MKKYILIIALFVTSLAFSQGGYTKPVVTAINVTIADAGAIITATEVENALQENRTAIDLNTPKETNVSTDLTTTHNASTVVVNSSDGTDATINAATATTAGIMSEAIYDAHVLNNAKETNVVSLGDGLIAQDITDIGNLSGTNTGDQTIPVTGVDFDPVGTDNSDNNAVNTLYSGLVTNATHTGEVTGATALTVDATAISNKTTVTPVATDMLLLWDATDSALKKVDATDFLGAGIAHLEWNDTDKTVWNNGFGDIDTNTSFGDLALKTITNGNFNTANGYKALELNTTGINNTANGSLALSHNSTGSNNIATGWEAGRFLNNGFTENTASNQSVFLGSSTRAFTNADANQIVIGYLALGAGSNTVTIGNSSITDTYLKGDVNITGILVGNEIVDKSNLAVALKTKVALGNVSGTVNIDTSLGIHFTMNMTGNITSLTFSNLTNEELKTITLEITGDAGGYTITQPATVKPDNVWSSLDSTLKNQIQIYMFDISTPVFSTTLLKL